MLYGPLIIKYSFSDNCIVNSFDYLTYNDISQTIKKIIHMNVEFVLNLLLSVSFFFKISNIFYLGMKMQLVSC